jgi:hypothetical protein
VPKFQIRLHKKDGDKREKQVKIGSAVKVTIQRTLTESCNIMKRLSFIAVGVVCLLVQSSYAQLVQEGFNYTAGSNLGDNLPWTGSSDSHLQITSGNLTYSGLTDLGGNQLTYTGVGATTAAADLDTFPAGGITSGSVYASFLIQCTAANPTGGNNYIMSLTAGGNPSGGSDPLAIYTGTSGTDGWKIGVRHQGVASGAAYETTKLAFNTTYLVVAQYLYVAGTANDVVNLYLNPVAGGAQPGTPSATQSTGTGPVDATSINALGFRVGQTTTAGNYIIDNLFIGTAWEDVTMAVPEPTTFALGGLGLLGLVLARRVRR